MPRPGSTWRRCLPTWPPSDGMSAASIAALGVFLSGMGSLLTAVLSVRWQRRKSEDECAERIREIRAAWREGMKIRKQIQDEGDEERWSHLP